MKAASENLQIESAMDLDSVVDHRLRLASEHLEWSPLRIAAFQVGFSDARKDAVDRHRMHRHDGESHGFLELGLTRDLVDSLGYSDGVRTAEVLGRDAVHYVDRDQLLEIAWYWADNGDGDFDINEATWSATPADDLTAFLKVMSREAWVSWFVDEHRAAVEAGREGYGALLTQDIVDPVIYVSYVDDRIDVWDGWHRVGAAMLKGAGHIPSIRGEPAPALVHLP
jgi:hypothetical protein